MKKALLITIINGILFGLVVIRIIKFHELFFYLSGGYIPLFITVYSFFKILKERRLEFGIVIILNLIICSLFIFLLQDALRVN